MRINKILLSFLMVLIGFTPALAVDSAAPNSPIVNDFSFPNGQLTGRLSFTLPSTASNGTALTEQLSYYCYFEVGAQFSVSGEANPIFSTGKAQPGETIVIDPLKFDDYVSRRDFGVWAWIYVSNSQGRNFSRTVTFIGYDTPNPPLNVVTTLDPETNDLTLSWEHNLVGRNASNKGYIDVDGLEYSIERFPGKKVPYEHSPYYRFEPELVAEGLHTTTWTQHIDDAPYEGYSYRIGVTHHGHGSGAYYAYSDTVRCGHAWDVPYLDLFENSYQFNRYLTNTVIDNVYKANISWTYSNGGLGTRAFTNDNGQDSDYWLIYPPIAMQKDKVYQTSFAAKVRDGRTEAAISILLGQNEDTATFSELKHEGRIRWQGNEYDFDHMSQTFTVPADGDYRLALHDVTKRATIGYSLWLDSLAVDYLCEAAAPDSVYNLKVTPGYKGANEIYVDFDLPTRNAIKGEATALERATIMVDGQVSTQFTYNLQAADHKHTTLKNISEGYHTVTVSAFNAAGKGLDNTQTIWVGPDSPKPITNIRLNDMLNDQQQAVLTWTPVDTVGVHGGYVDPAGLKYYIYEQNNTTPANVPDGAIEFTDDECRLVITGLPLDHGEASLMWFYVRAENELGSTAMLPSNSLVMGAPVALPFVEDVPNGFTYSGWWNEILFSPDPYDTTDERKWQFGNYGAYGHGKQKGAFGWYSNNKNMTAILKSMKVTSAGIVHPVMEFYTTFEGEASPTITVTVDNAQKDPHEVLKYSDPEWTESKTQWRKIVIDLQQYIDPTVPYFTFQIATTLPEKDSHIFFDEIHIYDLAEYDLATSIDKSVRKLHRSVDNPVTVFVKNLGLKSNANYTVELHAGDRVVDTKAGRVLDLLEEDRLVMTYRPTAADDEFAELQSVVVWAEDLNEENNTSEIYDVTLIDTPLTPVSTLTIADKEKESTLTWTKPEPATAIVEDDFEAYTPWYDPIGRWTTIDVDKAPDFGPYTWDYPLKSTPYAWALFNWDETSSTIGSSYAAHSGSQCLTSISTGATSSERNDEWIISPLLSGKSQQITFWLSSYGTSTQTPNLSILASSTGTDISDFTEVQAYPAGLVPTEWSQKKVRLPEGTKHFAIRTNSDSYFLVAVDDITYEAASGELKGYNIYRDGLLVETIENTDQTELTIAKDEEEHTFQVAALYDEGESSGSNTVTALALEKEPDNPVGIAVTSNDGSNATHYNTAGQLIDSQRQGMHILRYGNKKGIKIIKK